MATVTTPRGEVFEGVTGALLDYYRSEGYEINEPPEAAVPVFPLVFNGSEYTDGDGNPVGQSAEGQAEQSVDADVDAQAAPVVGTTEPVSPEAAPSPDTTVV